MGEQNFEKISNEKIDEISELELVDKNEREKNIRISSCDKYQKEIRDELIELFEDNYFSLMEKIDKFSENISDKEFKERFDFDIEKLRYYVDYAFPELLGRINSLANKNKIKIISHNSLRDVLSNAMFNGSVTVSWFKEHINDEDERVKNKIANINSGRRKGLEVFSKFINSKGLEYYIKELCSGDENVIGMEVGKEHGFLSEFVEYFNENKYGKIFPTGSAKFPYFRFFNEAEKWKKGKEGEINEENFELELSKLDDEFVNKKEIRKIYLAEKNKISS